MLSIFLSNVAARRHPSQRSHCLEKETVAEKLACFSQTLNSITETVINPYLSCQFTCQKFSGSDRHKCEHKCQQLDYSSSQSEECILKCSSVLDPINQQQCLSKCRSYKRSDFSSDYSDGCQRCTQFSSFVREFLHKIDDSQFEEGLKKACTTQYNLIPICQAVGTAGFENVLHLLLSLSSDEELCRTIKLCNQ